MPSEIPASDMPCESPSRKTNPATSDMNPMIMAMMATKVTPPGRLGVPYQLLMDAPSADVGLPCQIQNGAARPGLSQSFAV